MSIFKYENLCSSRHQASILFKKDDNTVVWSDFLCRVKAISNKLSKLKSPEVVIYCEEAHDFSYLFLAALYAGKNIVIPGIKPSVNKSSVLSDDNLISEIDIKEEFNSEGFIDSLDITNQQIILQTSGSTGKSKDVYKTVDLIENELLVLSKQWGTQIQNSTFYSTVSHQHFYGLLFTVLLPLISNSIIHSKRLHYPESLYAIQNSKSCLVSSPAFYKRLTSLTVKPNISQENLSLFSSGGFLPETASKYSFDFFGTPVYEVYGSTETGGIAYKTIHDNNKWRPFPGVRFSVCSEICYVLSSYIKEHEGLQLSDQLEFNKDGSFLLLGRIDSVVKVEEKRVALNDIENRLLESGLITDVAILFIKDRREYIAVAIELNKRGLDKFKENNKIQINTFFRLYLKQFFHTTVLPKKWRYPKHIPRNSQGKISKELTLDLFNVVNDVVLQSFNRSETELFYVILHPENYRYFDGHFPDFKILPAVAQIDWVMNASEREFGITPIIHKIPRLKFSNPIFPDIEIIVNIRHDIINNVIHFKYITKNGEKTYSSGKIFLEGNSGI